MNGVHLWSPKSFQYVPLRPRVHPIGVNKMIVELKGIRFSKEYTKPIEIHLESMRADKTQMSTGFTAVTEEGQIIVLYLPEGKPFVQVGWAPR